MPGSQLGLRLGRVSLVAKYNHETFGVSLKPIKSKTVFKALRIRELRLKPDDIVRFI